MGFFLRKAKKIGPLRLNLSKSGIGISGGVTGARLGVSSQGRTYVHMGRHGLYYRKNIGQSPANSEGPSNSIPAEEKLSKEVESFHSEEIENLTDAESKDFINELQKKSKKIEFWKWLGLYPSIILLLYALFFLIKGQDIKQDKPASSSFTISKEVVNLRSQPTTDSDIIVKLHIGDNYSIISIQESWVNIKYDSIRTGFVHADMGTISTDTEKLETTATSGLEVQYYIYLLVFAALLFIWTYFMFRFDLRRKSIELYYAFDGDLSGLHNEFIRAFESFGKTYRIWEILTSAKNKDTKYSGGASASVDRILIKRLRLNQSPTPYLDTNIEIPYVKLKLIELFFLPERLLLRRNNKYAAINYRNIRIEHSETRFIESNNVPKDAVVVDHTWQYVNKNGSPDKRFKDNRKLPICNYAQYHFTSEGGVNELLMTSKLGAMHEFIAVIEKIANSSAD